MGAFLAAVLVTGARARKVGIDPDRLVGFYLLATAARTRSRRSRTSHSSAQPST
jgi:hypothetical protein